MTTGIRSVTMDDLAQRLGVSKKTLYKHFANKRDLVEQTMACHVATEAKTLDAISADAENAIDEMLRITRHVNAQFAGINPATVFETRKYYPRSWQVFEEYKNRVIYERILTNLRQGMEQGLYRPEINAEILARIYVARIDVFFDPRVFPHDRFRITDIYREFMDYHIRGIASREGVAYLEKRINRQEQHDPS